MSIESGLFMSKKELIEFEIIEKFRFGKLSRVILSSILLTTGEREDLIRFITEAL